MVLRPWKVIEFLLSFSCHGNLRKETFEKFFREKYLKRFIRWTSQLVYDLTKLPVIIQGGGICYQI